MKRCSRDNFVWNNLCRFTILLIVISARYAGLDTRLVMVLRAVRGSVVPRQVKINPRFAPRPGCFCSLDLIVKNPFVIK